ncbi:MAG: DNA recombination protein RmuC [bacterium]|nr:DNA recombination protein RmuC [bacterium]
MEERVASVRKASEERLADLGRMEQEFREAFQALSSEALKSNNQSFLDLAKSTLEKFQTEAKGDLESRQKAVEVLVNPIKESIDKIDSQMREIEKSREGAYSGLLEQVKALGSTQQRLQQETGNLVRALGSPGVRGQWGEMQLRRVVELAGMISHCDFTEQESLQTEGGRLRPDLIVRLPGQKNVIVDAKAPLHAFIQAQQAEEESQRVHHLKEHARLVRDHIQKLSAKEYWSQFESTPEFVVMFLPGESLYSAAFEQEPALIEEAMTRRVILASPINLIGLLWTIAYSWQQEKIAESAHQIGLLGKELHQRLRTMAGHFGTLGKSLDRAVESYNNAVGSYETRVLISARRFEDLGTPVSGVIDPLSPIERTPRVLNAPEVESPPVIDLEQRKKY